jgi:hypothetical protein
LTQKKSKTSCQQKVEKTTLKIVQEYSFFFFVTVSKRPVPKNGLTIYKWGDRSLREQVRGCHDNCQLCRDFSLAIFCLRVTGNVSAAAAPCEQSYKSQVCTIKTQINLVLLHFYGRFGHQDSAEKKTYIISEKMCCCRCACGRKIRGAQRGLRG